MPTLASSRGSVALTPNSIPDNARWNASAHRYHTRQLSIRLRSFPERIRFGHIQRGWCCARLAAVA